MEKATLFIKDSWIHVRTPYHPKFIEALKTEIPWSSRKWSKEEKVWLVDPAYLDELITVCEPFFDVSVLEPEPEVVVMLPADAGGDPYSTMLRLASPDLCKKIYRLIAAELHPDRGGDASKMTDLNLAWEAIQKSR